MTTRKKTKLQTLREDYAKKASSKSPNERARYAAWVSLSQYVDSITEAFSLG